MTLGCFVGVAVMLMALPAFAQKNPEREAYFGGRYYAEAPRGGPDWGLRFTVTLLFPR